MSAVLQYMRTYPLPSIMVTILCIGFLPAMLVALLLYRWFFSWSARWTWMGVGIGFALLWGGVIYFLFCSHQVVFPWIPMYGIVGAFWIASVLLSPLLAAVMAFLSGVYVRS